MEDPLQRAERLLIDDIRERARARRRRNLKVAALFGYITLIVSAIATVAVTIWRVISNA